MPVAKLKKAEINYQKFGQGEPLLILHGGVSHIPSFYCLIPFLEKTHEVYVIDEQGYGLSPLLEKNISILVHVQNAIEFIDTVVKKPVHLYGHSNGGLIAILVTSTRPEIIKSLTLADPLLFVAGFLKMGEQLHSEPFRTYMSIAASLKAPGEVFNNYERIQSTFSENGLIKQENIFGALFSLKQINPSTLNLENPVHYYSRNNALINPIDDLKEIKVPTLLIQADPTSGGINPPNLKEILQENKIKIFLIQLKNIGHGLHLEDPIKIANIVLPFTLLFSK